VASTHTDGLIAHGAPTASALTSGYHVAFWIAAGLVAVAIAVAVLVLTPRTAVAAGGEPAAEAEFATEVCTEAGWG